MQLWECPCGATGRSLRASAPPEHLCSQTGEVAPLRLVEGELEPVEDDATDDAE